MTPDPFTLSSAAVLQLFPPFLQVAMALDPVFRADADVELAGTIHLGQDQTSFDRDEYFAGIRAVHGGAADVTLVDGEEQVWTLAADPEAPDEAFILSHADVRHRVRDPVGLKPDAAARLADFDRALDRAGLAADAMPDWRARLTANVLTAADVGTLEIDLANTPKAFLARLSKVSGGNLSLEDLVPASPLYYERLGGTGVAADLAALARDVISPQVTALLRQDPLEGAKLALALGSHGSLLTDSPLGELPAETLLDLAVWVVANGDPISRLAFLEVGIAALPRVPALEEPLLALAEDLLGLDPDDPASPLQLLVSLFILVDGQLSASGGFTHYQPFQRRHLALAQASLIARAWGRTRESQGLANWSLSARGSEFHLQTLIDLRREPRWHIEFASATQWKAEILGRLLVSARALPKTLTGALADKLRGAGETDLPALANPVTAFRPGPLEGAMPASPTSLGKLIAVLDEPLAAGRYTTATLTALINLSNLFQLPEDRFETVVGLIRAAQYRMPTDVDPAGAANVLLGLAEAASANRNTGLAQEVRVMARRRRLEDNDRAATIETEFNIAMTAAAAHADVPAWATFIGDWMTEIAFAITDKAYAADLALRLDRLAAKAPVLRPRLAHAIAALESFGRS